MGHRVDLAPVVQKRLPTGMRGPASASIACLPGGARPWSSAFGVQRPVDRGPSPSLPSLETGRRGIL